MIRLLGAPPGTILTADPLIIDLMGFIVMPVSWNLLTLAQASYKPDQCQPVNAAGVSAGAVLGLDSG